jgi:pimeloyl-ACP methyl ester carboxylesterase
MSPTTQTGAARPTIVLIPGWHEKAHDLRVLVQGRGDLPGLTARGYDASTFDLQDESLPHRINRFAAYLASLKRTEPWRFPVSILGYSLGGIVARGVLRAHPALRDDIGHVVLLGAPNWGLQLSAVPQIARIARLPWRELYDIDPGDRFVPDLNGTDGKWVTEKRKRVWVCDREPWVVPPGTRVLAIGGLVPRFRDGDGLVSVDEATMGGRIPNSIVTDPHANHLNLTGETAAVATIVRGFLRSDGVWPRVLDAVCTFTAAG